KAKQKAKSKKQKSPERRFLLFAFCFLLLLSDSGYSLRPMEAIPAQFEKWSVEDSTSLYMIDRWGGGYFDANANGDLTCAPLQENGIPIPLIEVLREAKGLNLQTPLLIRFQDLLRHRVEGLNSAFNSAIAEHNYRGAYRG